MAGDLIAIEERLSALVMRPRAVQRCYEMVECGGEGRAASGALSVEATSPPAEEGPR